MTTPGQRPASGAPIDREFLEDLFDRWERNMDARDEQLRESLAKLALRWWLVWFGLSLIAGLIIWAVAY